MDDESKEIPAELDDQIFEDLGKKVLEKDTVDLIKKLPKNTIDSAEDLKIIEQFRVGRNYWDTNSTLKKKEVCFAFKLTAVEREIIQNRGIPKISSLLTYLKTKFGGLDSFDVVFFRVIKPKTFYFEQNGKRTNVYVNLDKYIEYSKVLNPEINHLKVTKYSKKILFEFAKKVPEAFFRNSPPSSLVTELKQSNYRIIEQIINEYENLPENEKKDLKTVLEHSKLGDETFKEFTKLKTKSPAKQLKSFLNVIDKLETKEVEILLKNILKSKSSRKFIKSIGDLAPKDQSRMAKNLPEMTRMYERYEKLEDSLKKFKVLIKKHSESTKKDEKEIHRFLEKHYWLLGIDYFGRTINSDIDSDGKQTGKTKIGRKRADFIILQRLDGLDKCVVIELEEANDKVFNKDGTISAEIYDGIVQAIDYSLEKKLERIYSRGIAIIGSLAMSKLTSAQKKRWELLCDSFPNVEILTYDHIIQKAQTTLEFWKRYETIVNQ